MRYMLLIYRDETAYGKLSEQERGAIFKDATEFSEAFRPTASIRAASRWSRQAPPRRCG